MWFPICCSGTVQGSLKINPFCEKCGFICNDGHCYYQNNCVYLSKESMCGISLKFTTFLKVHWKKLLKNESEPEDFLLKFCLAPESHSSIPLCLQCQVIHFIHLLLCFMLCTASMWNLVSVSSNVIAAVNSCSITSPSFELLT